MATKKQLDLFKEEKSERMTTIVLVIYDRTKNFIHAGLLRNFEAFDGETCFTQYASYVDASDIYELLKPLKIPKNSALVFVSTAPRDDLNSLAIYSACRALLTPALYNRHAVERIHNTNYYPQVQSAIEKLRQE